jgi:segregation and condensation protein A
MKTFSLMIRNLNTEQIIDMYEEVTVNEKITLLNELLENKGECRFIDLVLRTSSIMDIVCALLAVLEAVKMRMVVTLQNRMFGDILIKPYDGVIGD